MKFATNHSQKVHGKGNIVVSYKRRIKNVHNVLYVFKCEEKIVVYKHFSKHGLWSHVWNKQIVVVNAPYIIFTKYRRDHLNGSYKLIIPFFQQRNL